MLICSYGGTHADKINTNYSELPDCEEPMSAQTAVSRFLL